MENKPKKYIPSKVYLPVVLAVVLISGFILGLNLRTPQSNQVEGRFFSIGMERYDKVRDVINYVYDSYVDSVSREYLTEETIRSMLDNLDPHSSYIPASDYRRLTDPLMGSFEGIGIEFNMVKDTLVVIQPITGGPSERAGIMPGDRIVQVDDTLIAGVSKSTDDVVSMLLGQKGTVVDVKVFRFGVPDLLEFSLTRDKIPSYSLDIAYMTDEVTGYIRLSRFSATSHQEFMQAMDNLQQQGMEQLILDLRGNGGGFLDAAIHIADELLEPRQLIVYTDGRKRPRTYARSMRHGIFETQPLIVLIDEWSASASEIIAGAVQDNDRGLVVGRRSFGKGLVQEQVQLSDGSALRLTVARYYTPTGRSIQKPYDEGLEAYYSDLLERFHSGELTSPDSIRFDDSLRFETPAGRTVYGGGGIMPDIFVPLETVGQTAFFNQVSNRGYIYLYAFDYVDRHRSSLAGFKDAAGFVTNFSLTNVIFRDFLQFIQDQGMQLPRQMNAECEAMIKTHLKAYIGRNMYGAHAFYPVLHTRDRTLDKAMEALRDQVMLSLLKPAESS